MVLPPAPRANKAPDERGSDGLRRDAPRVAGCASTGLPPRPRPYRNAETFGGADIRAAGRGAADGAANTVAARITESTPDSPMICPRAWLKAFDAGAECKGCARERKST